MTCRYYTSSGKESINLTARAVGYSFRIGDRAENIFFFRNVLGMKVLRHEEFIPECKRRCRNPNAKRWSRTVFGFGPESESFVFEVIYTYGVKSVALGNSFVSITIKSGEVMEHVRLTNYPIRKQGKFYELISPDGYKFLLIAANNESNHIQEIALRFNDAFLTLCFWNRLMGMQLLKSTEDTLILAHEGSPVRIRFDKITERVDHGEAAGRLAFATQLDQMRALDIHVRNYAKKITVPLLKVNVAGKADVRLIRFRDANLHEVTFVDEVGYSKLDKHDPESEKLLDKCIEADRFQDQNGASTVIYFWRASRCKEQCD